MKKGPAARASLEFSLLICVGVGVVGLPDFNRFVGWGSYRLAPDQVADRFGGTCGEGIGRCSGLSLRGGIGVAKGD